MERRDKNEQTKQRKLKEAEGKIDRGGKNKMKRRDARMKGAGGRNEKEITKARMMRGMR